MRKQYTFEEMKDKCPYDVICHMVAIGTLDRETFYQIVQYRLATGMLSPDRRRPLF